MSRAYRVLGNVNPFGVLLSFIERGDEDMLNGSNMVVEHWFSQVQGKFQPNQAGVLQKYRGWVLWH